LKRDTGEDVPRALAALAERVRYGRWSKRAPRVAANEVDPPLVGRDRVHREAFDTLSRGLAAGPQALAIIGAPGMGRTRLLRECADRLELEGTLVFFARPLENDQDAPWSTLRLLLRQLADAPGLTGASPDAVGVLAGLSPALAERFPQREVRDVADMAASLADVLAAVAEERPLTIALDDAHWADGASLAALRAALVSVRRVPIVLVLTVATGVADPPRELLALQSEIGRTLPGTSVRLDPLTDEDLGALVAAIAPWCADRTDRGRLTRRLARETGGNPFFAVTLLRALQQATALRADLVSWPPPEEPTDAPLPFSIPSLLRHALGARLTDLGDEDILVLRAASVCGQQIDMDLVAHVAERMPADVERALPAFERRQLVAFDGQRYAFVAPLVAEVVRAQCLTKGERQRLERRAIEALGSRTDLEGRVRRVELLAGVGPGAAAFAEAVAVGREALAVGAMRVARRALHAAERAGEGAADRAALAALREGVRRERRA
jgi:adenylate cyclase